MINAKTVQDQVASASSTSQWRLVWRGFRKRRLGMAGLIVLTLLVLGCIFVPIFWPNPYDYGPVGDNTLWNAPIGHVDPANGHVYILGSDTFGRDNFSLLFQGGRLTLLVAFVPAVVVLFIGSIIGAVAGYYGGTLDIAFMRTADFLIALPLLPAYVISIRIIGSSNQYSGISDHVWPTTFTLIAVFVLFGWMGISRLVRSLALSLREQSFVEAARALGASNRRIIFRHLIPNMVGPLIVACMFVIGDFVIMEAILAYFGLSYHDTLAPTTVSWGNMLASNQSWSYLVTNFNPFQDIRLYLMVFPGVLILITVLCVNFIGDALRDVLDPRLHV